MLYLLFVFAALSNIVLLLILKNQNQMSTKLMALMGLIAAISVSSEKMAGELTGIGEDITALKLQLQNANSPEALDEAIAAATALESKMQGVAEAAKTLNDSTTQAEQDGGEVVNSNPGTDLPASNPGDEPAPVDNSDENENPTGEDKPAFL